MKALLLTDLHGKFPKIVNENFDFILCGGDIGDDSLIKEDLFKWLKSNKKISFNKYVGEKKIVQNYINIETSTINILEKLNKFNVPVLLTPGNIDLLTHDFFNGILDLLPFFENIKLIHHSYENINNFSVIGYGLESSTELILNKEKEKIRLRFHSYYKRRYITLKRIQEDLFKTIIYNKKNKKVIYLIHNPPYKVLDRILWKKSPKYGENNGSIVARKMILKYKPLFVLTGHMHEYQDYKILGKTLVINSGYGNKGKYAIIDFDDKKINKLFFYKNKKLLREIKF